MLTNYPTNKDTLLNIINFLGLGKYYTATDETEPLENIFTDYDLLCVAITLLDVLEQRIENLVQRITILQEQNEELLWRIEDNDR